jgi:hypothetical protein
MRFMHEETNATVDSAPIAFHKTQRGVYRPCQASIGSAATCTIQGRNDTGMPWADLHEFTASGAENVLIMRWMRVSMTGNDDNVSIDVDVEAY